MNKLKSRESFDLLVLKELITKMAGFETTEDTDDVQLAATSGGDTLRSEVRLSIYRTPLRNFYPSYLHIDHVLIILFPGGFFGMASQSNYRTTARVVSVPFSHQPHAVIIC